MINPNHKASNSKMMRINNKIHSKISNKDKKKMMNNNSNNRYQSQEIKPRNLNQSINLYKKIRIWAKNSQTTRISASIHIKGIVDYYTFN